jgi:hypothetical protein
MEQSLMLDNTIIMILLVAELLFHMAIIKILLRRGK